MESLEQTEKVIRPFQERIYELEQALQWIFDNTKEYEVRLKASTALTIDK